MSEFSHLDKQGRAHMVDVSSKPETVRCARAGARVYTTKEVIDRIRAGRIKKGAVLDTARLAGIQAAKRTADLIPLCHTLMLDHVDVSCTLRDTCVNIEASARTTGRTGVEMEAITAASVAASTIYDMCKAVDRAMVISNVRLLEKFGGRSGHYRARVEPPRICFVAPSGTGKTTYLERLVPALVERGFRIGTIKHDAHEFQLDHEGKDSFRLRAAGATRVVIANEHSVGVHGDLARGTSVSDLVPLLGDVDLVLVEGYRDAGLPVVMITRIGAPSPPHEAPATTIAAVGDGEIPWSGPRFPLDDPEPMVEFLCTHCGLRARSRDQIAERRSGQVSRAT